MQIFRFLAALIVGIIALAFVVGMLVVQKDQVLVQSPGQTANAVEHLPATISPGNIAEIEKVLLYPGGHDVSYGHDWPQYPIRVLGYVAPGPGKAVAEFYKAELIKSGWAAQGEYTGKYNTSLQFIWPDTQRSVGYKLWLNILIDNVGQVEEPKADSASRVTCLIQRLPDTSKMPLYPGAREVMIEYQPNKYGFKDQVTTYRTSAKLEDVERYYKSTLPNIGWSLGGYNHEGQQIGTMSIQEGLTFTYYSGGPEGTYSGSATISALPEAHGDSTITIRSAGNDVESNSTLP